MKLSISRYNPELDSKPYMQDYEIALVPADHMLLDLMLRLKHQDSTLSFRKSCREGVCGSDAMSINGRNGLACITPVRSLRGTVVLRPLPSFPIIRDLVEARPAVGAARRLQSPAERERLNGAYECILCGCCSSQCPSYWWNPAKFVGPAGLLQAYRFIADSRDKVTDDRLENLRGPYRLFRCRTIMNCAEVCPKGLEPSHAIEKIRLRMLNVEASGGLDTHTPPPGRR